MVQGFSWFKSPISSRVQSVEGFNRFKLSYGLIHLRVQFVQGFNWFKGSIGSMVQLVQWFNWFNGSIGSMVQLVQGFNLFKGSLVQGFNKLKILIGLGLTGSIG